MFYLIGIFIYFYYKKGFLFLFVVEYYIWVNVKYKGDVNY